MSRDPVHDAFANAIMLLGRQGVDPLHIRSALAVNLVNLCKACGDPSKAVTDVTAAIEVLSGKKEPPS